MWANPHFNPPVTPGDAAAPWDRQVGHWSQHCPCSAPQHLWLQQHQGCKPGSHLLLPGAELSPEPDTHFHVVFSGRKRRPVRWAPSKPLCIDLLTVRKLN